MKNERDKPDPDLDRAWAFATDALDPEERTATDRRCAEDDAFRAEVESCRVLVARLRSHPEYRIERNAADAIPRTAQLTSRRVPRPAGARPAALKWAALALAALGLVVAGRMALNPGASTPSESQAEQVRRAKAWLIANQETDGSWRPERWGGREGHTDRITALGLLALLRRTEFSDSGGEAAAIDRALRYLRGRRPRALADTARPASTWAALSIRDPGRERPVPGWGYQETLSDSGAGWIEPRDTEDLLRAALGPSWKTNDRWPRLGGRVYREALTLLASNS